MCIKKSLSFLLGFALLALAITESQSGRVQTPLFNMNLPVFAMEVEDSTLNDSVPAGPDQPADGEYRQFLPAITGGDGDGGGDDGGGDDGGGDDGGGDDGGGDDGGGDDGGGSFQPTAPYYATVYYPWYKSASVDGDWSYWQDHGNDPPHTWFSHFLPDPNPETFDPSSELYSSEDQETLYWQLSKMKEAKLEVAISSWWGQGDKSDVAFGNIIGNIMNRQDNPYRNLRWSIYYEAEGDTNPTVSEIIDDLNYIAEHYVDQPAFLRVDNKPVIFVYAGGGDNEEMVERWMDANAQADTPFYVVLKVFSGYSKLSLQPDSWHQYGPAKRASEHTPYSYAVSPGFWLDNDQALPRLPRDLNEFQDAVADMVAADATWKLVLTWNEWGEGTSVEPGEQVRFNAETGKDEPDPAGAPFGNRYIDVLNDLLPPLEVGTVISPSVFAFAAGGDHGATRTTTASLELLSASHVDFYLALGDLGYGDIMPEAAWCEYILERTHPTFPFEILVGNHEDVPGVDGFIDEYAKCLPDRLGVKGVYAHRYYFDYPADAPIARIILIDPNVYFEDDRAEYCKDGEITQCEWLQTLIDEAKAQGLWTIVGMHKNCIDLGLKPCEIGVELLDMLIENKVDLILQAHSHTYQRSKQLALGAGCPGIVVEGFDRDCVVDDGTDKVYTQGQGSVILITGVFGVSPSPLDPSDPEAGYFTAWMDDTTMPSSGFMQYDVSEETIRAQFINSKGDFEDSFTIAKESQGQ